MSKPIEDCGVDLANRAISVQIWNPPGGYLDVITDAKGQFTIDKQYRNLEIFLHAKLSNNPLIGLSSAWVRLDNDYVEVGLQQIPIEWTVRDPRRLRR